MNVTLPSAAARQWALRAGWFVLTVVLLVPFIAFVGLRPRPVLVIAVLLGGFAVAWVVADVGGRTVRIEWTPPRRRVMPRHGLDPRFLRLASLMKDCWNQDPRGRPSFSSILDRLKDMHI